MDPTKRRQLNHDVRALAHGKLGLNEDQYRGIVSGIDPKSGGHITHCDDETAALVKIALERMLERRERGGTSSTASDDRQHKQIAKLMDYLKWDWHATASFCLRITGRSDTRKCSAAELSKVIRGMIDIIEHNIGNGELVLTQTELDTFRSHTRKHRD